MFEKILTELKTKYKNYGLSETILKAKAKQIAKAVNTEEEIEEAVAGVEDDLAIFQSFADQNRTLAKKLEDLEKGKGGDPKPADPADPKPNDPAPTGDVPEWAKAIIESNKALTENLTALQQKEAQQTNAQKFQAKLKELDVSDDFLKTLPVFERNFTSDEEIENVAKEYKEKSDVFVQLAANSALANMPKPLMGSNLKEGEISPMMKTYLETNKSNNETN